MKYSVVGKLALLGEVRYSWEDGEIVGNSMVKSLMENWAAALEGHPIGFSGGYYRSHDFLADPVIALALAKFGGIEILEVTGDVPKLPPVPEGFVA